jgi:hypothetical protein
MKKIIVLLKTIFVPAFLILLMADSLNARQAAIIIYIFDLVLVAGYGLNDSKDSGIYSVVMAMMDKLLISSTFICFAALEELRIPIWMVIIIVINEFIDSGFENVRDSINNSIKKTAFRSRFFVRFSILFITVALLLIKIYYSEIWTFKNMGALLEELPYWITFIVVVFSVFSGINNVKLSIKSLQEEEKNNGR